MSTEKKNKSDRKKKKCSCVETSCSKSLRHKLRSLEGHQVEIGLVNGRTICGTIVRVTEGKVKLANHLKSGILFVHISICHIDSVKVEKHKDRCKQHKDREDHVKHPKKECFEKHEQVI